MATPNTMTWRAPEWWTRPIAPTHLTRAQLATSLLNPSPRTVRFRLLRSLLRWRPMPPGA